MNADNVRAYCDQIDALTQQIREEVTAPGPGPRPPGTVVQAGEDLQAALDAGGALALEPDATFEGGGFRFTVPETAVAGLGGNVLTSTGAAAITVPVGMREVALAGATLRTSGCEVVAQVGRNDTQQTTVEQAPRGVQFRRIHSDGHRGKRCFEIDAADVAIRDCEVLDLYDPERLDNQAISIMNTPGPVVIEGGHFEAASENLMVGGDSMKIPNCRPTGITIRDASFSKPLAWRDQGVPVKNLLELKDGHDVLIERCHLSQCWKSGQDGYAFMFTPSNGGSLQNVVVRGCTVWDVGGIVNITGTDASNINPQRTQVSILGGEYRTNKATMQGSGRFCLMNRGPEWFIVEDALIAHEGSSFIDACDDKKPVDLLRVAGCTWNYGTYGIRIAGANHGDNSQGIILAIEIEGNTISGAHSHFRDRYPHNTYVDSMSRDREVEVDRHAQDYAREFAEELKRVRQWEREYRR